MAIISYMIISFVCSFFSLYSMLEDGLHTNGIKNGIQKECQNSFYYKSLKHTSNRVSKRLSSAKNNEQQDIPEVLSQKLSFLQARLEQGGSGLIPKDELVKTIFYWLDKDEDACCSWLNQCVCKVNQNDVNECTCRENCNCQNV